MEEFEELLEARDQELSTFQSALRRTEADESGDLHSFQRQLDKTLYLLVKKKRSSHCWQMPQGSLVGGESLLQVSFIYIPDVFSPQYTVSFPRRQLKGSLPRTVGHS